MRNRNIGLTLAEVLVTSAIIAILAALVFSVYSGAHESAKATVCIANLRQIASAMLMYQDDHGVFPPNTVKWPGLGPYLGGTHLRCPVYDEPIARLRVDYLIHAFFGHPWFGKPLDGPCMEQRGPAYPIAHDVNHARTKAAYRSGQRFYLFVRQDGSVGRVDSKWMWSFELSSKGFPCPGASYWSNF